MTEQSIVEALRAKQPFEGLFGVQLLAVEQEPKKPADFDLTFSLKYGERKIKIFAEIKSVCTPKSVQQIVPWLARFKKAQEDAAVALVCPSLSPTAQQICLDNNVDFIDLAGNISINVPGKFLLQRLGRKGRVSEAAPYYKNPFSGKASRVVRVLLEKPKEWTLTEIAQELFAESERNPFLKDQSGKINLASISKTVRGLEEELFIRRRNSSILVPEPERLLFKWAEKYTERYRWNLRSSFKVPNPFGEGLASVNKGLAQILGPTGFAFTAGAATAVTAPFVEAATIDIFVPTPKGSEKIRELKSKEGAGPDIRVIYPYDIGVFMYPNFVENLPLVSDVQAFLDLFARGGRDLKQAEYLLEKRIKLKWRKT